MQSSSMGSEGLRAGRESCEGIAPDGGGATLKIEELGECVNREAGPYLEKNLQVLIRRAFELHAVHGIRTADGISRILRVSNTMAEKLLDRVTDRAQNKREGESDAA